MAVADVRRSIHILRQVGVSVSGIVENMSYLICEHSGDPIPIFGSGGGQALATELKTILLGQIPIDPIICAGEDVGIPITIAAPHSTVGQMFVHMATAIESTFYATKPSEATASVAAL